LGTQVPLLPSVPLSPPDVPPPQTLGPPAPQIRPVAQEPQLTTPPHLRSVTAPQLAPSSAQVGGVQTPGPLSVFPMRLPALPPRELLVSLPPSNAELPAPPPAPVFSLPLEPLEPPGDPPPQALKRTSVATDHEHPNALRIPINSFFTSALCCCPSNRTGLLRDGLSTQHERMFSINL